MFPLSPRSPQGSLILTLGPLLPLGPPLRFPFRFPFSPKLRLEAFVLPGLQEVVTTGALDIRQPNADLRHHTRCEIRQQLRPHIFVLLLLQEVVVMAAFEIRQPRAAATIKRPTRWRFANTPPGKWLPAGNAICAFKCPSWFPYFTLIFTWGPLISPCFSLIFPLGFTYFSLWPSLISPYGEGPTRRRKRPSATSVTPRQSLGNPSH